MAVFEPVIRIIVAEDHPMMLEAILARLDVQPDIAVIAVATHGEQLVELYRKHQPDIVLSDVAMSPVSGLEAARRIRRRNPDARIVMLSGYDDPTLVAEAAQVGALGYILKTVRGDALSSMLQIVARDGRPLTSADGHGAIDLDPTGRPRVSPEDFEALSPRELQILEQAAGGLPYKAIGEQLGITENTVKTHLSNVYAKLKVTNRTAAVLRALDLGIIRNHG